MMKVLALLTFLFVLTHSLNAKVGIINDPDGYTNVRLEQTSKSKIIARLLKGEKFEYFPDPSSNWWLIKNQKSQIGYVHKSRITFVSEGFIHRGKASTGISRTIVSKQQYDLGNGYVRYFLATGCSAFLQSIQNEQIVDSLNFDWIEAVGGSSGLVVDEKFQTHNHLVMSKFGDYDGRLIIVDQSGKIQSFKGGTYFMTSDAKYLVSEYNSDLSLFTVYDIENKKAIEIGPLDDHMGDWYIFKEAYYALDYADDDSKPKVYRLDFSNNRVIKTNLDTSLVMKGKKILWSKSDCSCN